MGYSVLMLFLLAIPIASISWTVTHEEVFKEIRVFCVKNSHEQKTLVARKFFYLFTCEYCFSHYITIFILIITHFQLLYDGWRGYLIAGFSLVWIANQYMSLYRLLRVDIKTEDTEAKLKEKILKEP
ncbi:MAG: hypothetical protein ACRYFA_11320 [Janthinobacterium lividum]